MEKQEITKEGKVKLELELKTLVEVDREETKQALIAARAQGDLSENADYDAARNKQAEIEARIVTIRHILDNAVVVEPKKKTAVAIGSVVTILDLSDDTEATYSIVGSVEANIAENKISTSSPVGQAIEGHTKGDICTVRVDEPYDVKILKVS